MEHPKSEKRVEYLELVYDLIFVFIVGRNNSLLHHVENGYITAQMFLVYVLCTLAVIQIWSFTTFYLNLYGRNGVRDHVFLFLNMFLLYHMATGISAGWETSFYRFSAAWALILINLAVQHLIELRNHHDEPAVMSHLKRRALILSAQACLVGVHILIYSLTGVSTAYVPILFGILASVVFGKQNQNVPVDFAHLTERAMLYVVFTFGEMIISLSVYFTGELTRNNIYFSTMAFLIVAGLFLSYGTLYNKIIDREAVTGGTGYMLIHVFLIFALNNISVALEFMRDGEVDLLQKTVLLVGSFVLYFTFLFLTARYAKNKSVLSGKFLFILIGILLSFAALMLLFRENMYINIAVTVVYVYGIFLLLYRQTKKAP